MSKTTRRLGKPTYTLRASIDTNPMPSDAVIAQRNFFNNAALSAHGVGYDKLTDQQKSALHLAINEQNDTRRKAAA